MPGGPAAGRGRADAIRRALRGRFGAPLRWGYTGVVRLQLAAVALVDRLRPGSGTRDPDWLAAQLTVTAKTFLRPATARRMVRSVRRVFTGRVVIADDSPTPMPPPDDRTTVVPLPFNSGVPRGRNAALQEVTTPFVLVTDDDAVFTRASDLEGAVRFLLDHPEVDGVCAFLIELPRWYAFGYGDAELYPGHAEPRIPFGTEIDGLPVVMKGPNLYVARTEAVRDLGYDEGLRMVEHRDFFTRAAGRLVFVQSRSLVVYHARTPFHREYTSYRDDVARDLAYLTRKWPR